MSARPTIDPECLSEETASIDVVLRGRPRDLGGFTVQRTLPARERRMVGPFIFFDEMGPAVMAPGQGMDVRPHPHIGLATVTYLYAGAVFHRDSLGNAQEIRPGDVNWMLAGGGIVHSERTPPATRQAGGRVHGIQLWVALPRAHEEDAPRFEHHDAAALPVAVRPGARLRLLAGAAYGLTAPVGVLSPTFYVDAALESGATLPLPDEHAERAVYVVSGAVSCDARRFEAGNLLVFHAGAAAAVRAAAPARLILLGGAPLDGERHVWWNFVSSSTDRIERAKRDWQDGRFPRVPGDDVEFIPLPG
jgi:redox-sensitive bicupin YhaK (pirin superfamily)